MEEASNRFNLLISKVEEEKLRQEEEKQKLRQSPDPICPKELPLCLRNLGLNLNRFDCRGDRDFTISPTRPSQIHIRGGFEYFRPVKGMAYGINIGDKTKLFGEWAVGFHGVRNQAAFVNILSVGLRPGPGQAFASQKDYSGELIVPTGVYFSPDIRVCLGYSNAANPLILQCLINPSAIRTTTQKNYWVVEKTEDIVPYRIISHPFEQPEHY